MGSSNPPWWWQIGAALKGGDMLVDTASKGTGLVDWWQQRQDAKQAADDLAKFQADPSYVPNPRNYSSPLSGKSSTVVGADGTKTTVAGTSPYQALQGQLEQYKQLQAKPALGKVQSALQDFGYADNNFTPSEWTQGIAQMYAPDAPANNPYFNEGLKAFEKQGANITSANRGDLATLAATSPEMLKSFVDANKGMADTAESKWKVESGRNTAKLASDTGLATQEFSVWMTTPEGQQADGAQRQAKMNTLLPAQTSMEDRTKLATIARVNPELIAVTVGRGLDRKQEVMVDKNTGKEVNSLGEQWAISSGAPKTTVTVTQKADDALAGALGAGTVKELSESKQAALKERTALVGLQQMDKLLESGLKTGKGQGVNLAVRSVISGITGSKDPKLAQAQLYEMYSKQAAMGKVKTVDSAPAQAFINQIINQYPGLTRDSAANIYMTKEMIRAGRANIADHNKRLELSGFEGADKLSGITKNVYGVTDPFEESAPKNVFRQKLGGK